MTGAVLLQQTLLPASCGPCFQPLCTPASLPLPQVDAAAVRQQRLGGGDGSCPVSLEMLAEYEEFVRNFK